MAKKKTSLGGGGYDSRFITPITSGPKGKGDTWPRVENVMPSMPDDPLGIVPKVDKGYRNEKDDGGKGG